MQPASKAGDCSMSWQEVLVQLCGHCNAWQPAAARAHAQRKPHADVAAREQNIKGAGMQ